MPVDSLVLDVDIFAPPQNENPRAFEQPMQQDGESKQDRKRADNAYFDRDESIEEMIERINNDL